MEGRKQATTNIICNQAEGRCTAECKQWQKVRTARGDFRPKVNNTRNSEQKLQHITPSADYNH